MGRMDTSDLIALIHLVGFITGVLLYGMLAVMTWRTPRSGPSGGVGSIPCARRSARPKYGTPEPCWRSDGTASEW